MTERIPTADEIAGMYWWKSLTEQQRVAALQLAKANTVPEAWNWQKQVRGAEGFDVNTAYGRGGAVTQDEKSWTAGYFAVMPASRPTHRPMSIGGRGYPG